MIPRMPKQGLKLTVGDNRHACEEAHWRVRGAFVAQTERTRLHRLRNADLGAVLRATIRSWQSLGMVSEAVGRTMTWISRCDVVSSQYASSRRKLTVGPFGARSSHHGPALFGARELDQANLLVWRIGTGCLSWQRVRDEVRGLEEGRSVGQASVQVREGLDELQEFFVQLRRVRNVGREGLVRVMQSGKDRGVETERQRIV